MSNGSCSPAITPKNLKGWLILLSIYALAGAILGSPSRGPVSTDDADWHHWVGLIVSWAIYGVVIGAASHWLSHQFASYKHAMVSFAIILPMFMLLTDLVRLLAAWFTGGWQASWISAVLGALVGVAICPLVILLFTAVGKLLGLFLRPPKLPTEPMPMDIPKT